MSAQAPRRWLVVRLEAPLLSFGGVAIDNYGVIWDFPPLSMLTGLFANALGYERTERELHQALQDRLIVASRRDDEPYHGVLTDYQNARIYESESGWTTRGAPESRNSGQSYSAIETGFDARGKKYLRRYMTHQRYRDYHPDALLTVVVSLHPVAHPVQPANRAAPSLDDLAQALDRPERPLFIGRKPCLPAYPLNAGFIEAETAHAALSRLPPLAERARRGRGTIGHSGSRSPPELLLRAQWPAGEGPNDGTLVDRSMSLADHRNWLSGLHSGTRRVVEGRVRPAQPASEITP